MWEILRRINKNLVYAIPLCMLAGFLFGGGGDETFSRKLKLLIISITFLMVSPMMVTLNVKHLKQGLDHKLRGTAQVINFALSTIRAKIFFSRGDGIALVYGTVMRNLLKKLDRKNSSLETIFLFLLFNGTDMSSVSRYCNNRYTTSR